MVQGCRLMLNNSVGWRVMDIKSFVQEWVTGTSANQGLILVPAAGGGGNAKQFASSDAANISIRPVLRINYTVPLNISFVPPTPANGSTVTGSSLVVNVTLN